MMASVFAMQGFGQVACAVVALVVTTSFKDDLEPIKNTGSCTGDCQIAVDRMWRIVIVIGAIPGLIALYASLPFPSKHVAVS